MNQVLDGAKTPRVEELYKLMLQFESRAILTDNIWGFLWGKLVYGALLFGTALTNDGIADALENPVYRPVLSDLGRELLTHFLPLTRWARSWEKALR